MGYTIKRNQAGLVAIFHENGKQISEWFDEIWPDGLVKSQSKYFIARKNEKWAIFHENGKQISDWFDRIKPEGLVKGQSQYYCAQNGLLWAIFHKNGKQISNWFDEIKPDGLLLNQSEYFLAEKYNKWAIFHKSGQMVEGWFDWVYTFEPVADEGNFFIAQKYNKQAIFRLKDKLNIKWYDEIESVGYKELDKNVILYTFLFKESDKYKLGVFICFYKHCKMFKEIKISRENLKEFRSNPELLVEFLESKFLKREETEKLKRKIKL